MKNIFKNTAALLFAAIALTSCLKDDTMVLDPEKAGSNIIEFANPVEIAVHGSTTAAYTMAYPIIPTATTIPISISYSGVEDVAPEDITVKFAVGSQAVIDQYNTEQNKTFVMMPTNLYTISSTNVVILKGRKTGTFTISTPTSQFDLTRSYALPLTITSSSRGIISGNFGTIILNLAAKNAYDGIYKNVSGSIQRYTNPTTPTIGDALNGTLQYNPDVTLKTIDANTVEVSGLRWGSSTGGAQGSGVAGIDNLQIVVDPVTNLVTMKALGNPTLKNVVGRVNKWDPATKTFTLNFDWNPTAAKREYVNWVITYRGVRP